jgi:hypothetical protein
MTPTIPAEQLAAFTAQFPEVAGSLFMKDILTPEHPAMLDISPQPAPDSLLMRMVGMMRVIPESAQELEETADYCATICVVCKRYGWEEIYLRIQELGVCILCAISQYNAVKEQLSITRELAGLGIRSNDFQPNR